MLGAIHLVNKDTFLSMSGDKFLIRATYVGLYLNGLSYRIAVLGPWGCFSSFPKLGALRE